MAGEGRKEEIGKAFEEGTLVPCHQVPLEVLRKRLPVEANGIYWGQTGGIAALIQGVHVRGRDDVELEVMVQGTNLESILKWATGSEDKVMRVHLCGGKCISPSTQRTSSTASTFVPAKEDLPWMMNLVVEPAGGREAEAVEPPIDKEKGEEKKEKKKAKEREGAKIKIEAARGSARGAAEEVQERRKKRRRCPCEERPRRI